MLKHIRYRRFTTEHVPTLGRNPGKIQIPKYWHEEVLAASLTTMKVGGPIRYLHKVEDEDQLAESIAVAEHLEMPIKILGGGSNLIFSDQGFAGLIIGWKSQSARLLAEEEGRPYHQGLKELNILKQVDSRYSVSSEPEVLDLAGNVLVKLSQPKESQLVELPAGMAWGQAVQWSLNQGLAGLHWFARIPCQVGGAIYNNIHGEKHLLSEYVVAVRGWDLVEGKRFVFFPKQLLFAYDYSVFHMQPGRYLIQSAILNLPRYSPDVINLVKQQYLAWVKEKTRVQPSGANAGSVFKNLSPLHATEIKLSSEAKQNGVVLPPKGFLSAGKYIDLAGLKGEKIGGMQVFPGHANFILNTGKGSQADFIALVNRIRHRVFDYFGIELDPEIECINASGVQHQWPGLKHG